MCSHFVNRGKSCFTFIQHNATKRNATQHNTTQQDLLGSPYGSSYIIYKIKNITNLKIYSYLHEYIYCTPLCLCLKTPLNMLWISCNFYFCMSVHLAISSKLNLEYRNVTHVASLQLRNYSCPAN